MPVYSKFEPIVQNDAGNVLTDNPATGANDGYSNIAGECHSPAQYLGAFNKLVGIIFI